MTNTSKLDFGKTESVVAKNGRTYIYADEGAKRLYRLVDDLGGMTNTGFNDQFNDKDALKAVKLAIKDQPYEMLQGLRNSLVRQYSDVADADYSKFGKLTEEDDIMQQKMSILTTIIDIYLVPLQEKMLWQQKKGADPI